MARIVRAFHTYWAPFSIGLILTGLTLPVLVRIRGEFAIGGEWTIPIWTCILSCACRYLSTLRRDFSYIKVRRDLEKRGAAVTDEQFTWCVQYARQKARSAGLGEDYVILLLPDVIMEDIFRRAVNTRTEVLLEQQGRSNQLCRHQHQLGATSQR